VVLVDRDPQGVELEALARTMACDKPLRRPIVLVMMPLGTSVDADRLAAVGVSGILYKPIAATKLRAMLTQVLGSLHELERPVVVEKVPSRAPLSGRILVADDDATNQLVAVAILSSLGYHTDVVDDGVKVIQALKARRCDAVLLDCEMPRMDGYQASLRIRDGEAGAANANVLLLALTANALAGARQQCLAAGMNDYLAKPIERWQLGELLDHWLSASRASARIFDENALLKRLMGDRALGAAVVAAFLQDAPQQFTALNAYLARNEGQSARRQAHTLKGAAATVSAIALCASAAAIEKVCVKGDLLSAASLVAALQPQLEAFATAARELTALRDPQASAP
jgi:two-component system sensor histidine kinase/response regulator